MKFPEEEDGIEATISCMGYSEQYRLFTLEDISKPLKVSLKPGIELTVVEVVYTKGSIEQDRTCYCQLIRKDELTPWKLEIELLDLRRLEIYPNPFLSTLTIEMEVKTSQPHLFHLYNEAGQLVFAESRELETGLQTTQLDLVQRHLPEGAYFLRISDDDGEIRTKRLVKVSP